MCVRPKLINNNTLATIEELCCNSCHQCIKHTITSSYKKGDCAVMAYTKVLTPSPLRDLLGPLNTEEDINLPVVEDPTESRTRSSILCSLEEQVRAASNEKYTLVVPPTILDQVADDVLRIAQDEPCGLRGCVLTVRLADDTSSAEKETYTRLAQVKADQFTPTTHELLLTLRPDPTSWITKMARIFRSLSKRRMVVSPKYELIKTSLYNFED